MNIDQSQWPLFETGIIGQAMAKGAMKKITNNILSGGNLPHIGFYDEPGLGKSALTQSWAIWNREKTGVIAYAVNCKQKINNTDEEFRSLCSLVAAALDGSGDPLILILDEVGTDEDKKSGGSAKSTMAAWRSIVGGNASGGAPIMIPGHDVMAHNPKRFGIILTTWHGSGLQQDAHTRFPQGGEFKLEPYSMEELQQILPASISRMMIVENVGKEDLKIHPSALRSICRAMRGNARTAEKIAEKICRESNNWKIEGDGSHYLVDKKQARVVMKDVSIFPFGLESYEVEILSYLNKAGASKRAAITEKVGVPFKDAFSKAVRYLETEGGKDDPFQMESPNGEAMEGKKGELIALFNSHYSITPHGKEILSGLKALDFIK